MIIFHISGSPGSGKSTFIEWLAKNMELCKIRTIDTDDFISNIKNENDLAEIVNNLCEEATMASIEILVFAGILSPESGIIYEFPQMKRIVSLELWFVDEPDAVLLSRFYGRYAQFKDDQEFWNEIANKQLTIPSSTEYLSDHQFDITWHRARDYHFISIESMKIQLPLIVSIMNIPCDFGQCQNKSIFYDRERSQLFCSHKCYK